MRVSLDLDPVLISNAKKLSGISDTTALVHAALKALIEREAARRLAAMGGGYPELRQIPRRRPSAFTNR